MDKEHCRLAMVVPKDHGKSHDQPMVIFISLRLLVSSRISKFEAFWTSAKLISVIQALFYCLP